MIAPPAAAVARSLGPLGTVAMCRDYVKGGPGRRLVTTILATTPLGSIRAVAQEPRMHRTALWASAAIGPTLLYEWAVFGSAGFRHARVLVRARYAITFENPGARVDDVGILVGVVITPPSQRGHISVGAGAGRVRQVYNCFLCGSPTFPTTNGFLLDAEGRLALLSFGGVALGLFVGGL